MPSSPQKPAARLAAVLSASVVGWALAVVAALGLGASPLDLGAALDASLTPNPDRVILLADRLPRALLASIVGAGLSMVGCAFQTLMRNPLADPFILGTSGGAALGATIGLVMGGAGAASGLVAASTIPMMAFAGALLSLAVVHVLSGGAHRFNATRILLLGVVFNFFASAVITFLKAVVGADKAQEILFWLMGTLALEGLDGWSLGGPAILTALGGLWLWRHAVALNALGFGAEGALSLGVDVTGVRRRAFVASSLMVGAAVSASGLIGFVGLVVPHVTRLLLGPDHRFTLPASAIIGATFLVLCDLAARSLFSVLGTEAPVGVVTAFIGAPAFVWLLLREQRMASSAGSWQ